MKTPNAFQKITLINFIQLIFCLLLFIPLLLYNDTVKELFAFSNLGNLIISIMGIIIIWGGYLLSIFVPMAILLYITELLYNYIRQKSIQSIIEVPLLQNQPFMQVASITAICVELYLSMIQGKLSLMFCLLISPWYKHWYNGLQF